MSNFYTILINDDHSFTHTNKKRLLRGSKNIDGIKFLVKQMYNDLDMTKVNAILEYKKPISCQYGTIVLTPESELYKNRVQYILPVDTTITGEIGEFGLTINFSYLSMSESGEFKEQVRPVGSTALLIEDTPHWSDYIPSADLSNIAQMAMMNQASVEQNRVNIEMMNEMLLRDTASTLTVEDGKLYLVSAAGEKMGSPADVVVPRTVDDDALPGDGLIELGEIEIDERND